MLRFAFAKVSSNKCDAESLNLFQSFVNLLQLISALNRQIPYRGAG